MKSVFYLLTLTSDRIQYDNYLSDKDPLDELIELRKEFPGDNYTLLFAQPITQEQYEKWNGDF